MNITPAFLRRKIAHRPNLLKIVDNISWLFFDKLLRMGVGLVLWVWVARYLGPDQFGVLSFAMAFVGLYSAIAGLGLDGIVVRDIVCNPPCKEETLGTAAVLQIFGGLLAYALLLVTIFWLRPDNNLAKILVAILGATMVFKASEVAVYWFESQVQSKYTVWVQNSVFLVFAFVKILLIFNKAPLVAFVWATMAEALLVAILLCLMLGIRGPKLRQLRVTMVRAKTLLKDSWPLMLSGIAIMIYMKIDQIMLGQMVGDEEVGIYSAAVRISEVWYFIPMMIVASVFPAVLAAKTQSKERYRQLLQHLYDLMVWLSVAVTLPMTFLSTPFVILLFGEAYAAAGPVLAIHIWASIFVFLGVASSKCLLAENRQILIFQRTVLGALVNIGLNFLLIPAYGALGAATATVIAQFSVGIFIDVLQAETRNMFYMKINAFNPFKILQKIRRIE